MGLFFYTQKGSIISTVVLPTTEIIEPFKVVKVPESKGITLDVFDEFVGCLQFGVRIRKLNSVYDVFLVVKDSSQSCFKGLIEMW